MEIITFKRWAFLQWFMDYCKLPIIWMSMNKSISLLIVGALLRLKKLMGVLKEQMCDHDTVRSVFVSYLRLHSPGCSWGRRTWTFSTAGFGLVAAVRSHMSGWDATAACSGSRTPSRSPHAHRWSLGSWHSRTQWLHNWEREQMHTKGWFVFASGF